MGKCEHVIEKGKRKDQVCGIYTNKKVDNRFYCSSHYNSHVPKDKPIEKPIEKPKEIPKEQPKPDIIDDKPKFINERTLSLENGDSLDEVIEYEFKKMTDQNKEPDDVNHKLLKKIDKLSDRLYFIENHIKYNKIGKPLNIPEFEIFK